MLVEGVQPPSEHAITTAFDCNALVQRQTYQIERPLNGARRHSKVFEFEPSNRWGNTGRHGSGGEVRCKEEVCARHAPHQIKKKKKKKKKQVQKQKKQELLRRRHTNHFAIFAVTKRQRGNRMASTVACSSLNGAELADEIFESGPDVPSNGLLDDGVLSPTARVASSFSGGSQASSSPALAARAAFESAQMAVFLGRRYDAAEFLGGGSSTTEDDDVSAPIMSSAVRPSADTAAVLAVAVALERGLPAARRRAAAGAGAVSLGETPLRKLARLTSEVAALEEELHTLSEAGAKRPTGTTPVDLSLGVWHSLTAGVAELGARLERARPVAAQVGAAVSSATDGGDGRSPLASAAASLSAATTALREIEADMHREAAASAVAAAPLAAPPSLAASVQLEARLAALEAAALSLTPADARATSASGLSARLASLEQRLSQLPSGAGASASVRADNPAQLAPALAGDAARLRSAVETLERWDSAAAALPHVADRLLSLRDVHRELRALPGRLTAAEAATRAAAAAAEEDRALLAELATSMRELVATVSANIEALE